MKKYALFILLVCASALCAQDVTQPIRVGLMLPFQTEMIKRDKGMDRFVDFYTGALIAVYEVQSAGQEIEVYTYDVGKSAFQLEQVLAEDSLVQMDMIIGPAYPAQVPVIASWAQQHQVRTLLPFASHVPELDTNPYLMQFNPSERSDAEALVESVVMEGRPIRFVFVKADESAIPNSVREIQQYVKNEGVEYIYTTIERIMGDSLGMVLDDVSENILVMNTERFANLRQVMPYLNRAAQGKQLTLVTRYAWLDEPIVLSQIFSTVFRNKMDIDSVSYGDLYRRFVMKERSRTRPYYDLLGYDLMHYTLQTLMALKTTDSLYQEQRVIEQEYTGLQSDIRFERVGEQGGYQNKRIHIVRSR